MNQKIVIISLIIIHFTFQYELKAQDTWIQNYQPFGAYVSYFVEDIRVCPDEGYAVIGSFWCNEVMNSYGFMIKTRVN